MLYIYNLRILSYDLTGLIIAANYLDLKKFKNKNKINFASVGT